MKTQIVQARLPKKQVEIIDALVKEGKYTSRSDFIKQALKMQSTLDRLTGILPDNNIDSVQEVRKIRKELGKEIKSFEDIQKIQEL